jgi:hypothetical protein
VSVLRSWAGQAIFRIVVSVTGAGVGAGVSAAAPAEKITVPFACHSLGPRVSVTPAAPRSYDVIGPHETRDLAVCRGGQRLPGTTGCASVTLHRFDVMCGGRRVAWADMAAAIAVQAPAPAVPPGGTGGLNRPLQCDLAGRPVRDHNLVLCRWPRPHGGAIAVRIPAGFAPLAEIAARPASGSASGTPPTSVNGKAAYGGPARGRIVPALVTSQPLPDITPVALEDGAGPDAEAARAIMSTSADGAGSGTWLWLAVIGLMTTAAACAAAWRWPVQARRLKAAAARAGLAAIEHAERWAEVLQAMVQRGVQAARRTPVRPVRDLKAANAASAVSAMLSDTQTRLGDLKAAGPLRDVLHQEVSGLRQRLATLEVAANESEEAAQRASPGFRNLMRDVERVRRIADSAALSIGDRRSAARIPKTKSEAYDLLGLNPDAPEGTLKKVADGLRMSWHPDHARDDADRTEREARIKAINIAIELINGKRVAA